MNTLNRRNWLKGMLMLPLTGCMTGSVAGSLMGILGYSRPALSDNRSDKALQSTDNNACHPILSHRLRPLMGAEEHPLCGSYSGKVLLIVNTASKCGFTPQFESLETLYKRYREQGLEILGFPSDDFRQELDSEEAVAQFCELNYGVTFPMFQKIHVRGEQAHPLYQDLARTSGTYPGWNFNKYLVDRNGQVIAHYDSSELPLGQRMIGAIEALL